MKNAGGMIIAITALLALMASQPAYAKYCGVKFVRVGTEKTGPGPARTIKFGTQLLAIDRWQKKVARDPVYGPSYASWARADKRKHNCEVANIGNKFHVSCSTWGVPCRP